MPAQLDSAYLRKRPSRLWPRLVSYALFEGRPLTTRGRWINPLVFAHFALEKRLPQLARVEAPIFILGTGRSGTTILGKVLSMHRDVAFLNEPKALWHSVYPEEDLIGSYSRNSARYRLGAADVDARMRRDAHRLYGAYLCVSGGRRVVDKYPELIFRTDFVRALFPDARFILLVRSGIATCSSIDAWSTRHGIRTGDERHDWWGADRRKWHLLVDQIVPGYPDLAPHASEMRGWTDERAMAAVEWIVSMREALSLARDIPDMVKLIRYEDLCTDPRGVTRNIADFAGLRDDPTLLDYAAEVLTPAPAPGAFDLPVALAGPFAETTVALGYSNEPGHSE